MLKPTQTFSMAAVVITAAIAPAAFAQTDEPPKTTAQSAYFIPAPGDVGASALPKGRTQSETPVPQTRASGYSSPRPAAYRAPVAQPVYQSSAYPQAAQQQRSMMQSPANDTAALRDGVRAELHLGWDRTRSTGGAVDQSDDGLVYGLGIGYDHSFGDMFVGGYASIDWSGIKGDQLSLVPGTGTSTETSVDFEAGRDIEFGARVGYWFNDSMNVYGFAAYTNLEREASASVVIITPADPNVVGSTETRSTPVVTSGDSSQDGYRIGAGSEIILPRGLYAKAEYRYSNYGSDDLKTDNSDLERHQLMTGVGMRF